MGGLLGFEAFSCYTLKIWWKSSLLKTNGFSRAEDFQEALGVAGTHIRLRGGEAAALPPLLDLAWAEFCFLLRPLHLGDKLSAPWL